MAGWELWREGRGRCEREALLYWMVSGDPFKSGQSYRCK